MMMVLLCVPLASCVCFSISLSVFVFDCLSGPALGQAEHLGRFLPWSASHPHLKADD